MLLKHNVCSSLIGQSACYYILLLFCWTWSFCNKVLSNQVPCLYHFTIYLAYLKNTIYWLFYYWMISVMPFGWQMVDQISTIHWNQRSILYDLYVYTLEISNNRLSEYQFTVIYWNYLELPKKSCCICLYLSWCHVLCWMILCKMSVKSS